MVIMRFVCTTALTWKGFCFYKTRYKMTKICRIWVGYFLICMCCCSIKFTLKARSAISWIHIHKLLNGSQWSYISWSKKRYCNDLNIQTMSNRSTLNIHVLQTVHSLASHLTVSELVSQKQIMEYACKKHFQFGKKKKKNSIRW